MSLPKLNQAIGHYSQTLAALEQEENNPSTELILTLLLSRDQLDIVFHNRFRKLGPSIASHAKLQPIAVYYNNNILRNALIGQYVSCIDNYRRAINLSPDFPETHYNLGMLIEKAKSLRQHKI